MAGAFEALFAELSDKARTRPAGSGTVAALDAGIHGLGKKILEEAGEVWLAAEHESDESLAEEVSQLLYWTQVLMVARGDGGEILPTTGYQLEIGDQLLIVLARDVLKARPGVFAAGEMLDWEAPTGGYLLQASFASGVVAADGVRAWLNGR